MDILRLASVLMQRPQVTEMVAVLELLLATTLVLRWAPMTMTSNSRATIAMMHILNITGMLLRSGRTSWSIQTTLRRKKNLL